MRSPVLAYEAAVALQEGRAVQALALALEAVDLARAVDDRLDCIVSVLYRSLAEESLGQMTAAEAGFREIIQSEREMGAAPGRAWDARAGLVRLLLQQGLPDAALELAQPIVTHLIALDVGEVDHGLGACEQPLRVHLTAARTLMATAADDRADAVLRRASTLLTEWAESFDDPVDRQHLLAIPYHHEIVQLAQRRTAGN
jgi:hypothetical protein